MVVVTPDYAGKPKDIKKPATDDKKATKPKK